MHSVALHDNNMCEENVANIKTVINKEMCADYYLFVRLTDSLLQVRNT